MKIGLRERVLLRVDGGLKTGWDVVMAAAMGAEEFGFGTIAMIAEGCIMARICHTNKCPVGITTQNEALRKKFPGTPDNIVTFFGYVAEETRHILAELGYTSLDQVIGRPGVLKQRSELKLKKTKDVDVSFVLDSLVCTPEEGENFCDPSETPSQRPWLAKGAVFSNGRTFDDILLEDKDIAAAIADQKSVSKTFKITNTDRSAFARISGVLASKYGDDGFQGRLRFSLTGAAGQSFGTPSLLSSIPSPPSPLLSPLHFQVLAFVSLVLVTHLSPLSPLPSSQLPSSARAWRSACRATPTTTSVKAWLAAASPSRPPQQTSPSPSARSASAWWATQCCTAPLAGRCGWLDAGASALLCATLEPWAWWRGSATTALST
jgi:hypothetical protein